MTTAGSLDLLGVLVDEVRRTRHPFEPAHVTAERIWGLRRAPFGGITLETFAFVGHLAIRRGHPPVGYPISARLRAAALTDGWSPLVDREALSPLALIGFMTLAAERLNAEDTASRPVS
jgi:hypothetical protein